MIVSGHWICPHCGSEPYHLRTVVEAHGEEHLNLLCPFCHHTYEEAVKCAVCGKYVAESESLYDGDGMYYCTNCKTTCTFCGEIVDKDSVTECDGERICSECEREADAAIEDIFGKEQERSYIAINERAQSLGEALIIEGNKINIALI
jgi:hypothetical protein